MFTVLEVLVAYKSTPRPLDRVDDVPFPGMDRPFWPMAEPELVLMYGAVIVMGLTLPLYWPELRQRSVSVSRIAQEIESESVPIPEQPVKLSHTP